MTIVDNKTLWKCDYCMEIHTGPCPRISERSGYMSGNHQDMIAHLGKLSQFGHGSASMLPQGFVQHTEPLGILQRVDGLRSGLNDLRDKLMLFRDRLGIRPAVLSDRPEPVTCASGFVETISEAEERLSQCFALVNLLNDKF